MSKTLAISKPTLIFHWLLAVTIIAIMASGIIMDEFELYSLYPWHKSFGTAFLALAILRVAWRVKEGWLPPAAPAPQWQERAAVVLHSALLALSVLIPTSGIMMAALGGTGLQVFGFELVAYNLDPETGMIAPYNKTLASIGEELHEILPNLLIVAVGLHVVAALKHHIIDKDATLRRMVGKS